MEGACARSTRRGEAGDGHHIEEKTFRVKGRIQAADSLRVHQVRADLEPHQESGGHAAPRFLEKIGQGKVRAHGRDEIRALLEGQQHRHVFTGPPRGEHQVGQTRGLQPFAAGRGAVGISVHDQFRAAAQGGVGDAVHVADDEVGTVALLHQQVRAAVHANQHRAHDLEIGANGAQVGLRPRAPHHDQAMLARELGVKRRNGLTLEQQRLFIHHVSQRVFDELRHFRADVVLRLFELALQQVLGKHLPGGDALSVQVDGAFHHLQKAPLGNPRQQVVAGAINERNARLQEKPRSGVGKAAGKGTLRVDHRGGLLLDQHRRGRGRRGRYEK